VNYSRSTPSRLRLLVGNTEKAQGKGCVVRKNEEANVTTQDRSLCCGAPSGRLQIVADSAKSPAILPALQRAIVSINEKYNGRSTLTLRGCGELIECT